MTLHQLKCFITLSQTLHYTEAAKQLYLSQPSLSYAISTLEMELGVKLFEKRGKSISMTEYGKELLPYALAATSSVEAGISKLKKMKNPKSFKMGYIYSLSYNFLPTVLSIMPAISTEENFTFSFHQGRTEGIIQQLQDDSLDLAFSPYIEAENLSSLPVFSQEIFIIVSKKHPFSSRTEVNLSELSHEKFALISAETNLRYVIDKTFSENNFTPDVVFEGDECNSIASFVASDFGVSLLPKISSLDSYHLSFLRLSEITITRTIYLVWKTDSPATSIVQRIAKYLNLSL